MVIAVAYNPITGTYVPASSPDYPAALAAESNLSTLSTGIVDPVGDPYGAGATAINGLLNGLAGGEINGLVGAATTGLASTVGNLVNGAQIVNDYQTGNYAQLARDVGGAVVGAGALAAFGPEELATAGAVVTGIGVSTAGTIIGRVIGNVADQIYADYNGANNSGNLFNTVPTDTAQTDLYNPYTGMSNVNLGSLDLLAQGADPSAYTSGSSYGGSSYGGSLTGNDNINMSNYGSNSLGNSMDLQNALNTQSIDNTINNGMTDPYSSTGIGPYNASNPGYGNTPSASDSLYLNPSLTVNNPTPSANLFPYG